MITSSVCTKPQRDQGTLINAYEVNKKFVYPRISAEDSIILRYHKSFVPDIDFQILQDVSLREGGRIIGPVDVNGVNLFILDMASLMADGNFKSTVACMAVARSIQQGVQRLAVCSSGNTAVAMARYCRDKDIKLDIFIPRLSSYKFDYSVLDRKKQTLWIVDKPEWGVRSTAETFAHEHGLLLVPSLGHQVEANACRSFLVLEYMLKNNIVFDWATQAVSGGHGPVGFYKKLYSLVEDGVIQPEIIPGFIGVQQSGICPMHNAWINGRSYLTGEDVNLHPQEVLEPTLYCTRPDEGYRYLYKNVVKPKGGAFYAIDSKEYSRWESAALGVLISCGFRLKKRNMEGHGVITEKAGILSLMGALKAFEEGRIASGENVLVTFTGTTEVAEPIQWLKVM